jgi:hypothetical protein
MLKIIIGWVGILLTTSCTWQNTVHTIAQTPEYLRLDERVWVQDAPRWRLPATASVSVVDDGETPKQWVDAANAGVAQIFPGSGNQARYSLDIQWPVDSSESVAQADKTRLMDFIQIPQIPALQSLNVTLLDHEGQFVTTMNLHISPEVWGPTWQDMDLLQYSFTQLASTLRGG